LDSPRLKNLAYKKLEYDKCGLKIVKNHKMAENSSFGDQVAIQN